MFFAIYFKTNKQNFFVFVYFVCRTPQFMMLVFAFRSEIWIVQNFNFTVLEDFCLSLWWKYRFLQNVNHAKVQSKTNKYCKFHVDLTRKRLSKSRFKKLGMVPKKLYRNTLKADLKTIAAQNRVVPEIQSEFSLWKPAIIRSNFFVLLLIAHDFSAHQVVTWYELMAISRDLNPIGPLATSI